jgi:hypothetical protein
VSPGSQHLYIAAVLGSNAAALRRLLCGPRDAGPAAEASGVRVLRGLAWTLGPRGLALLRPALPEAQLRMLFDVAGDPKIGSPLKRLLAHVGADVVPEDILDHACWRALRSQQKSEAREQAGGPPQGEAAAGGRQKAARLQQQQRQPQQPRQQQQQQRQPQQQRPAAQSQQRQQQQYVGSPPGAVTAVAGASASLQTAAGILGPAMQPLAYNGGTAAAAARRAPRRQQQQPAPPPPRRGSGSGDGGAGAGVVGSLVSGMAQLSVGQQTAPPAPPQRRYTPVYSQQQPHGPPQGQPRQQVQQQ